MVRAATPTFPGHCLVKVAGKGLVPMSTLRVGDKVEAYDVHKRISCWSPITSFLHRDPAKAAPYMVIGYSHTLGSGLKELGSVTISQDHLIFLIEKGDMVPAGTIQIGQHLLVCHDGHMIMAEATGSMATMGQGFYAPITHIGTIVVDGIVAFAGHHHWWNRLFHHKVENAPLRGARTPVYVSAPYAYSAPASYARVYPLTPTAATTTTYTSYPTTPTTTTAYHYPASPVTTTTTSFPVREVTTLQTATPIPTPTQTQTTTTTTATYQPATATYQPAPATVVA